MGCTAQAFNRRHRRSGHVFQGRFGAVRIRSDAQLLVVARYIARNPVDAGLCAEPAGLEHARGAIAGASRRAQEHGPRTWLDTPRLLDFFGASGGDGRRRYAGLRRAQMTSLPRA